jgi:hypothetical protein
LDIDLARTLIPLAAIWAPIFLVVALARRHRLGDTRPMSFREPDGRNGWRRRDHSAGASAFSPDPYRPVNARSVGILTSVSGGRA